MTSALLHKSAVAEACRRAIDDVKKRRHDVREGLLATRMQPRWFGLVRPRTRAEAERTIDRWDDLSFQVGWRTEQVARKILALIRATPHGVDSISVSACDFEYIARYMPKRD